MDSITALAVATLMMLSNGAVLALMRKHLSTHLQPFAYSWQSATFAIALGCLIFPFHRHIPLPLATILANGPLLVGLVGYWHALRKLYGKPDIIIWLAAVVIVTLLGLLWFATVQPDTRIRIMIVSAAWLLFMGGSFFTLKSAWQPSSTRSHWVLLIIFGVVTLFTAVRAVYYAMLNMTPDFNIIDNSSFMNLLTPMVVVVLPIVGTTAFVLLLFERMRSDAAASQTSLADKKNLEQLSYLGHDLRAPLSTIVSYARLLGQTQSAEQASHLRAIERSVNYQMELIDEILDYAKRELQPLEMRLQPMLISTLLEDIIEHGKSLSGQQHNCFEFSAPTPLPELIYGDARRLKQILLNLISNAAKFTRNGHILFTVSAKPGSADQTTLRFTVRDTGSGINQQDQQVIFDAFEQREQHPGSVGLGLYIARTAIRNMGGELVLESSPGTGSMFSALLPTQSLNKNTITLPTQIWNSSHISSAEIALFSVPTPDALEALGFMAANGELSEIERWVETQSSEQPAHVDFYEQVYLALQRLDFTCIERLAGQSDTPDMLVPRGA